MFSLVTKLTQLFPNEEEYLTLPAGNMLFRRGDQGSYMYVVKYGNVDIRVDGKLVEIGSVGIPLGEESLVEHAPRMASVMASSDCKLIVIDHARLDTLIKNTPALLNHLKLLIELRRISWMPLAAMTLHA